MSAKKLSLVAGCLVAALLVLQASAVLATIVSSSTDVFIREHNPDSTYENDVNSVWAAGNTVSGASDGGMQRMTCLEFDLSGVTEPITSAYLNLYLPGSIDGGVQLHNAEAFKQNADLLSPNGISAATWNKVNGGSPTYTRTALESLGYYDSPAGSPVDAWYTSSASAADVAALEAIRTGTGSKLVTMLLYGDSSVPGAHEWGSEGYPDGYGAGHGPQLYLNQQPQSTPEPGSIVLLVMGLVGLLAYAWRKRK